MGQDRAFQAHTPWGNSTVFFDTGGGCCDFSQRISANVDTFPGHLPAQWGSPFRTSQKLGDVVMNCLNAPARIYRNDSPAPRIAVRLKGAAANARGIGAKISVSGAPRLKAGRDGFHSVPEALPMRNDERGSLGRGGTRPYQIEGPDARQNGEETLPVQTREMIRGGRYLSGDDAIRVFAAGTLTSALTIEVCHRP